MNMFHVEGHLEGEMTTTPQSPKELGCCTRRGQVGGSGLGLMRKNKSFFFLFDSHFSSGFTVPSTAGARLAVSLLTLLHF